MGKRRRVARTPKEVAELLARHTNSKTEVASAGRRELRLRYTLRQAVTPLPLQWLPRITREEWALAPCGHGDTASWLGPAVRQWWNARVVGSAIPRFVESVDGGGRKLPLWRAKEVLKVGMGWAWGHSILAGAGGKAVVECSGGWLRDTTFCRERGWWRPETSALASQGSAVSPAVPSQQFPRKAVVECSAGWLGDTTFCRERG